MASPSSAPSGEDAIQRLQTAGLPTKDNPEVVEVAQKPARLPSFRFVHLTLDRGLTPEATSHPAVNEVPDCWRTRPRGEIVETRCSSSVFRSDRRESSEDAFASQNQSGGFQIRTSS